jgi:hypothetical protein
MLETVYSEPFYILTLVVAKKLPALGQSLCSGRLIGAWCGVQDGA